MKKEDLYARMMHTPDDPARAELRAALRATWKQLLPLHRALIDASSAEYSANIAPVSGPNHLMKLLQEEPFFEWLRPLTSMIVDLDTLSRTDFQHADVEGISARLEHLFGPEAGAPFATRYVPMLQRDVDIAIAHAAVRKLMAGLKSPLT